jgi:hypothetical protein
MASLVKLYLGSFNQVSTRYSADSMGKQCVTNAAVCLMYSIIVSPVHWQFQDLDDLLDEGDSWYRKFTNPSQKGSGYLAVDQLPMYYSSFGENFKLTRLGITQNICFDYNENSPALSMTSFVNKLQTEQTALVIMIIGADAFSIIQSYDRFYVFDSHSRDKCGKPVPDGYSIQLTFRTASDFEHYIRQYAIHLDQIICEVTFFKMQKVSDKAFKLALKRQSICPEYSYTDTTCASNFHSVSQATGLPTEITPNAANKTNQKKTNVLLNDYFKDQSKKTMEKQMQNVRKDESSHEQIRLVNKLQKKKFRQKTKFKYRMNREQNKLYMQNSRKDESKRNKERSQDKLYRRNRRQNESERNKERAQDKLFRQDRRQNESERDRDKTRDKLYRQNRRQNQSEHNEDRLQNKLHMQKANKNPKKTKRKHDCNLKPQILKLPKTSNHARPSSKTDECTNTLPCYQKRKYGSTLDANIDIFSKLTSHGPTMFVLVANKPGFGIQSNHLKHGPKICIPISLKVH